jgi:hypothetical protein
MAQQNNTFSFLLQHPTKTIEEILVCTTIQQIGGEMVNLKPELLESQMA